MIERRNIEIERIDRWSVVGIKLNVEREKIIIEKEKNGERKVEWESGKEIGMIEIIGEFRKRIMIEVNEKRVMEGIVFKIIKKIEDKIGILRKKLRDNVEREVERRIKIWKLRSDVGWGKIGRKKDEIGEDRLGKRRKKKLKGDIGEGEEIRIVGKIKVLKLRIGLKIWNIERKLGSKI